MRTFIGTGACLDECGGQRIEKGVPVGHIGARGVLSNQMEKTVGRFQIARLADTRGPAQGQPNPAHGCGERHATPICHSGCDARGQSLQPTRTVR
jgi:hypothetical protein